MERKIKDYVVIGLKGMAMGAADVVPGVSGGTIAFISGIYEELLGSISNIKFSLFKTFKNEGFKAVWQKVNGSFLLALFVGIFISIISLAKAIKYLLENEPILLWSFFFGLVLASIIYIAKQITKWNFIAVLVLILGAFLAFYITTLNPLVSESSSTLFLFLAGAIAICAMILPGISGAFILVLLGAYKPILAAVNDRDFKTIAVALVMFVAATSFVTAQSKVAHIDVTQLLSAMPAMKTAEAELKKLSETYNADIEAAMTEFQNKAAQYQNEAQSKSKEENEKRAVELQGMQKTIGEANQNAQQELQKKQAELFEPISKTAKAAIEKVAAAQGIEYVIDAQPGGGLIVATGKDLLVDVKKELNIAN